ncbi:hypothetical protein VARIO8X_150163 [Burkholderiales bacterium 8X]|nr:hypothetical protein VARIO8X_150163 [Burkholderiales bacterium 8X]
MAARISNVSLAQSMLFSSSDQSLELVRGRDVLVQGAILNNSRTGAQTNLGGAVGANPWLANGAARVILNEVRSNDPHERRQAGEQGNDRGG